ncbi:MAG: ankyrin repeat domain-containing protein [Pseudomonadota bacterium]
MIKSNLMTDSGFADDEPDIFIAAERNDPYLMARAIQAGQSLDDRKGALAATPIHFACINGSYEFVEAAINGHEFDPWIKDGNGKRAIDHSIIRGDQDIISLLFEKMHGHSPSDPLPE